ncbi:MAG: heme-binding protein [Chloroflexi bacterium]|nr:heme-binding protein [Chloroflexota bacterium]
MYMRPTLSAEEARVAMNAMADMATRIAKRPVAIAITDHRGELIHFLRQDEALAFCGEVSTRKAYTAAVAKESSASFSAKYKGVGRTLEEAIGPRASSGQGGVPILTKDGVCLGGIGVSGDSNEGDIAIGRAGVEAMGYNWEA